MARCSLGVQLACQDLLRYLIDRNEHFIHFSSADCLYAGIVRMRAENESPPHLMGIPVAHAFR